jgi:hypothetical protein
LDTASKLSKQFVFMYKRFFQPLLQLLGNFKCIKKRFKSLFRKHFCAFWRQKNEEQMRQQTYFFFFQSSSASQSEAFLFLGLIQQNKFTNSSQNGLLICASKLQVLVVIYKLSLQVNSQLNLQVSFQVQLQVFI